MDKEHVTLVYSQLMKQRNWEILHVPSSRDWPAHVAECSKPLGTMCAQWPAFKLQPGCVRLPKNCNNSYTHDEQGDYPGQENDGSIVSCINCDRCSHLD